MCPVLYGFGYSATFDTLRPYPTCSDSPREGCRLHGIATESRPDSCTDSGARGAAVLRTRTYVQLLILEETWEAFNKIGSYCICKVYLALPSNADSVHVCPATKLPPLLFLLFNYKDRMLAVFVEDPVNADVFLFPHGLIA